ncbi:MAG TPA: 16S rRNA (cytosine(1402)-N(4))-methyltransferase RsmH [Longimicrobiaceae bacterium]|nr:16S rRNA (cytosine(1402)-N(4))-methyltransferase RsmH [Longimicrobiaceae bacterium]
MVTPEPIGYHEPVMVSEVLHYLNPSRSGVFLDGTLGGGGHAEALLRSSGGAELIGVDQDPEAIAAARERLAAFAGRTRLVMANFLEAVAGVEEESLAGALLDLGVSSHQIDQAERGFTFRTGAPLDMRMRGESGGVTAADLLNDLSAEDLAEIFFRYGEEQRSRRLAREVVAQREVTPMTSSDQLVMAIERAIPGATPQDRARIFQALRIAVNRETEVLESALPLIRDALAPGGVLVVLSYHSLEDRMVKNAFREWSRECICPPRLPVCRCRGKALGVTLTRKPVSATPAEIATNPRSRSARLRAWQRA